MLKCNKMKCTWFGFIYTKIFWPLVSLGSFKPWLLCNLLWARLEWHLRNSRTCNQRMFLNQGKKENIHWIQFISIHFPSHGIFWALTRSKNNLTCSKKETDLSLTWVYFYPTQKIFFDTEHKNWKICYF